MGDLAMNGRCIWLAVVVLASAPVLTAGNVAAADFERSFRQCANQATPTDARLEACTAVIESGEGDDAVLADAHVHRGNAHADRDAISAALDDYDRAIQLDPKLPMAWGRRALTYAALGKHDRAIADFDKLVALLPNDVFAYIYRGDSYRAQGREREALADYGRAIENDSDSFTAYTQRGNLYADRGSYALAIADYDQAIRIRPQLAMAYTNRGH